MQLTDAQLITVILSIVLPLSMLIYSNRRITEAKETLRAEAQGLRTELTGELKLLGEEMNHGFARIEAALQIHELEHHK